MSSNLHHVPPDCSHSTQILTVTMRQDTLDPDLYGCCSTNLGRMEIVQIVAGNDLVKALCFATMIVSSPSRRPYLG